MYWGRVRRVYGRTFAECRARAEYVTGTFALEDQKEK